MNQNPLIKLESFGQSIWIDYIRRSTIDSGELAGWIHEDGVTGVTSNPTIFEKAIGGSHDYDETIRSLAMQGKNISEIFRVLSVEDIQRAADLFRPVYDRTGGQDGFVSLEVSPTMAHDTEKSINEARELWQAVSRPNLMVKIPGTREGLPAIRQLTSEGLNINVTLLFGLPRYQEVTEAFISGLEERVVKGQPIRGIASVASFFLSRIDVLIDPQLENIMKEGGARAEQAKTLRGQVAIASAKIAYEMYQRIFDPDGRFKRLAAEGAQPQRLLWASTSTKNPEYKDTMYIEPLIAPKTINTVPVETLNAYRDHGDPAPRLTEDVAHAHQVMSQLAQLGINIDQQTQQLEDEGVEKFSKSFDQLMNTLTKQREQALHEPSAQKQPGD